MSTIFHSWEIVWVRRKGGVDKCGNSYNRKTDRFENCGERRNRQIAKRHFLRKVIDDSGSQSGHNSETIKSPGGKERNLKKPSGY